MFKIKSIYSKIVLTIFAFIITISVVVFAFSAFIRIVIDEPSIYSREITREIKLMGKLVEDKLPDALDNSADMIILRNLLEDFSRKTASDLRILKMSDMKPVLSVYFY